MILGAAMKLIATLTCKWRGHKRGKRLKPTDPPHVPGEQNVDRLQCPRCHATWTSRKPRKVKAAA